MKDTDLIKNMKELCICAAVKWKDKIWFGHRHSNALIAMNDEISYELLRKQFLEEKEKPIQGFITTKNRFVDRKEAYKIQIAAGVKSKLKHLPYLGQELYSEDLY